MDWSFLEDVNDVDEMLDLFYTSLYNLIEKSVPCTQQKQNNYPQWFSKEIIKNLKTKEYYRHKYRTTKQTFYLDHFIRMRSLVKEQIDAAYNSFWQHASDNLKHDPSDFWNFVRLKQGTSRIPSIVRDDVDEYTIPIDIVNAFDSYFSSVYSDNSRDFTDAVPTLPMFNIHQVTEEEIIAVMRGFSSKLTAGEDQIPSFLRWKSARITPVFKKGDKSLVTNYRPIAILSNFAKYVAEVMDVGGQVDVVYTNFEKAFDRIDHTNSDS
nr:uncharacterized protein LOC111423334 [Onthophagus taurus]